MKIIISILAIIIVTFSGFKIMSSEETQQSKAIHTETATLATVKPVVIEKPKTEKSLNIPKALSKKELSEKARRKIKYNQEPSEIFEQEKALWNNAVKDLINDNLDGAIIWYYDKFDSFEIEGEFVFDKVESLYLEEEFIDRITPELIEGLHNFHNLERLVIKTWKKETVKSLKSIDGLFSLWTLYQLKDVECFNVPLTDEGFAHIAKLKNLEYVGVAGTKVTLKGLRKLTNHRGGTLHLTVDKTMVTKEHLALYQTLRLRSLTIQDSTTTEKKVYDFKNGVLVERK